MPSTVNAAGRRKVRCPKCTALLTEPQTQIYECPICCTLLLAKGNSGGRSSGNRVLRSSGDADDIQQILEGGSKLEKATLVNESSNEFEGRSRTSQEGDMTSDNQPLSGIIFSTEPLNDLAPKNNALAPDTHPDTPHRRKSLHDGEISPRGGSGHRSSELDSASHSESEGDLDSPIWSSENANIGDVPEVSIFESSNLVDGSSEHLSTSRPSLSSGAGGNDGAQSLQEGSKFQTRKPSDARSSDRGAEEETEHEERHQNLSSNEIAHEEGATVEERPYSDCRIMNSDIPVVISSGKSSLEEEQKAKDENYGEVANDKDVDSSHNSSSDWQAGSAGSKSPQNNLVDSTPKERVSGDSKQQKDVETPKVGKFGLFDLSVFGIYNEDTYSELRRGKAAHYSKLSESGSDNEGVRSTVDGDLVSHSQEVAAQSSSREQDRAGNSVAENIAEVQKSSNVSESATDGTHIEAGSYGEVHLDREQDTDARNSGSVSQEVDDGDSDVLANARYGDYLAVRDLSLEVVSSVDVSFGDWRVQQVAQPPQKSLQTYVDEDSLYEKGMLDLASEEGTDSSWDDDELPFSSASKEDSKLKGTSWTDKGAQASPIRRRSIGRSQAKPLLENPALPFRTTAMQKLLQRNEQESTVQTHAQESIKVDSTLYEAPYMEHYTPSLEKDVHESAYQTTALTPESNAYDSPYVEEDKPHTIGVPEKLEDKESEITERQNEDPFSTHSTLVSNVGNEAVSPTPLSWKEEDAQTVLTEGAQSRKELARGNEAVSLPPLGLKENDVQTVIMEDAQSRNEFDAVRNPQRDVQTVIMEDAQSRKEFDAVRNPERDVRVDKVGMEMTDLDSQNVDYFKNRHINKVGSAPGKPVSLRWKGKGSSTQSLSSTEDDGAYGMESEAGSGPDRDTTKKQGIGLIEGHTFPDKEAHLGLGQQTRGHYQPAQRTWLSSIDVDRQKHGSGELITSRRSARSRAANARLSSQESFEQVDAPRVEGRISNLDTFGRSGLDRPERVPTRQSQALNLNRSMLDQGSNYSYNGTAGYNSDHSSRSQDPSRTQYNETYLSNSYGLPAAGSTQAHPFQVPPRGSVPRASLQEPGFTHSAHHCVSPTCSVCMQQQYYMQPPQMLQNVMLQPCAACASQSSATSYHQPMHHGMHSHMHGSTYSNPSLRQYDSGVLPVQSQRQNRSSIHHSHPLPLARRPKLYPPLPGKDAPPYVLCKHCNQLLQVPGYLAPISGPIQKLQCGSCEKISKFSVPLQAASPSANKTLWATSGGLAMHASDLARDKRYKDTSNIHSSDRIPSSGLAPSAQNLYGMARHTSGHGSQQEWVENRLFSQSSASGIPQTESAISRHHTRPMASVPEQYRSYGGEGEHLHNNTGIYSEGYLSSSPSSPSGSSPGRPSQIGRQHQQVEQLRQRRPGFGERTLTPDLPAPSTTMHEQGRPPFEAPGFSDDFFQKGLIENRSKFSSTSLQGSLHDPYSDSPRNEHLDRLQQASKAGSWHNQPADADYSGRSALRSRMEQVRNIPEQVRNIPAAPGSPLIEHFTQDNDDVGPTLQQRHMLQNSGNGPWSPGSESRLVDSFTQDSTIDFSERYRERERPPLPIQDASKGPKSFAGLFKRSMKDHGKGGQGGNNRRKVVVNGHLISEAAVRKAEEQAGPIHSGSYWYDYQAGFWGVMGGPCLGILMPFIEEFHYPLARDCSGGRTEILVNGRELHEKDLEVLAKRGLPTISGKAYILDISGALFDDVTGQPLRGLGKLAPSIEKKGRGFGMSPFTAQP